MAGAAAKVEGLIARANSVPLTNRLGDGQVADGAMLLTGVVDALSSRSLWPVLRPALASAFGGDGTELLVLANQLYERNPNGTYSTLANAVTAIDCLDRPWPRVRWPRGDRSCRRPHRPRRCSVRPSSGAA